MTGYTVHTGSTEKFSTGWDRIFPEAAAKPTARKSAKKQRVPKKPATKARAKKKARSGAGQTSAKALRKPRAGKK